MSIKQQLGILTNIVGIAQFQNNGYILPLTTDYRKTYSTKLNDPCVISFRKIVFLATRKTPGHLKLFPGVPSILSVFKIARRFLDVNKSS